MSSSKKLKSSSGKAISLPSASKPAVNVASLHKRYATIEFKKPASPKAPKIEAANKVGMKITSARFIDTSTDTRKLSQHFKMYKKEPDPDIRAEAHTFTQGRFSATEKDAIKKAIYKYADLKDIQENDFRELVHRRSKFDRENPYKDKAYDDFYDFVHREAAVNRSKDQIYWCMRRMYAEPSEKGAWTEEQDRWLCELVAIKGQKWTEIEREMGRTNSRVGLLWYYCSLLTPKGTVQSLAKETRRIYNGPLVRGRRCPIDCCNEDTFRKFTVIWCRMFRC